jgi:cytoskeleton protein RodZ
VRELHRDSGVTEVSGALRTARELAGLTLEEISSRTKIKVAFLRAIENGDFDRLPGPFFTRAFLRTYARELHLPADEIVAGYDARFAPVVQDAPAPQPPLPVTPSEPFRADVDWRWALLPSSRSVWPAVVLGIVVIAVISVMTRTRNERPRAAEPVGTSGVAETAVPVAASPPPAAVPQKLTIDIRPSRKMWVAGMADGKRVIYRLVDQGEHVRIDAHQDLWFRVGDAGAFVYSINGSTEKPLGSPGEVREFRVTRDTVEKTP